MIEGPQWLLSPQKASPFWALGRWAGDPLTSKDWLDFTNNLRFPMRSGMPSGNLAKANQEVPSLAK